MNREKLETLKKVILFTLGNIIVYHVMFPMLYLAWLAQGGENDADN